MGQGLQFRVQVRVNVSGSYRAGRVVLFGIVSYGLQAHSRLGLLYRLVDYIGLYGCTGQMFVRNRLINQKFVPTRYV